MLNVSQSSSVTSEFKIVNGENVTTTPRVSISHSSKGASGISRSNTCPNWKTDVVRIDNFKNVIKTLFFTQELSLS